MFRNGRWDLSTEHPATLANLNNLAAFYLEQGHYGKAEPLSKRALAAAPGVQRRSVVPRRGHRMERSTLSPAFFNCGCFLSA